MSASLQLGPQLFALVRKPAKSFHLQFDIVTGHSRWLDVTCAATRRTAAIVSFITGSAPVNAEYNQLQRRTMFSAGCRLKSLVFDGSLPVPMIICSPS